MMFSEETLLHFDAFWVNCRYKCHTSLQNLYDFVVNRSTDTFDSRTWTWTWTSNLLRQNGSHHFDRLSLTHFHRCKWLVQTLIGRRFGAYVTCRGDDAINKYCWIVLKTDNVLFFKCKAFCKWRSFSTENGHKFMTFYDKKFLGNCESNSFKFC